MNDTYNQPTDRPGHPDEDDFGAQVEDRARWLLANEPHTVLDWVLNGIIENYDSEQGVIFSTEVIRIATTTGHEDTDLEAAEGIRQIMRAAAERLAREQLKGERNENL